MTHIYFPALLRRIVNVLGSLSLSTQYFILKHQHDDPPPPPRRQRQRQPPPPADTIHQLLQHPTLYNPVRPPRYPLVLCHGLYGFDVRGPASFPSLRVHYWHNILNILRRSIGAEVIVTSVPGTGSIASRAEILNKQLQHKAHARGINLLAHSMGGLDCRHLISHIKPEDYTPLSLTTVSTPHRGSPFMDWCAQYIGIGKLRNQQPIPLALSLASLPSSFTTLLLSIVDSPAYANLTTHYLNDVFNPSTPDDPRVKYFSVASRLDSMSVWHPLWLPKMVCDGVEEKDRIASPHIPDAEWGNDGLVTVQSAKWGEFLGVMEGCDHWEIRGARGLDLDLTSLSSEAWSVKDWTRFIGAWKREEKLHQAAANATNTGQPQPQSQQPRTQQQQQQQERQRQREDETDDAIIKASTDKLSVVFDWLVDQVPTPILSGVGRDMGKDTRDMKDLSDAQEEKKARKKKNELETKEDLERFYVALSRRLYDEGL